MKSTSINGTEVKFKVSACCVLRAALSTEQGWEAKGVGGTTFYKTACLLQSLCTTSSHQTEESKRTLRIYLHRASHKCSMAYTSTTGSQKMESYIQKSHLHTDQ